ncbi:MAG: phosphopantothenoylcysteine decarboxylase [Planctomycetota bacterium]
MTRILITSGPTREYLDPVRYLSNASSGRMGAALAAAALEAGFEVTVVSGPVLVEYPTAAEVLRVVTTQDMADACRAVFPGCRGLIAAAAPCDYRPHTASANKLHKTGDGRTLELVETVDVVASLADIRTSQWIVAFALETEDSHLRAMQKLERKSADLIVVNGPAAIDAEDTSVEVLDRTGASVAVLSGPKQAVAHGIFRAIDKMLQVRAQQ